MHGSVESTRSGCFVYINHYIHGWNKIHMTISYFGTCSWNAVRNLGTCTLTFSVMLSRH